MTKSQITIVEKLVERLLEIEKSLKTHGEMGISSEVSDQISFLLSICNTSLNFMKEVTYKDASQKALNEFYSYLRKDLSTCLTCDGTGTVKDGCGGDRRDMWECVRGYCGIAHVEVECVKCQGKGVKNAN